MTTPWLPRSLSVSAVQCYTDCPALYARRYRDGVIDPPSGPLAFGRAMALALEAEHSGKDGDVAWVRGYEAEVVAYGLRDTASVQHGLALLAAYRASGIGVGQPEYRFQVYLPDRDAVPLPLRGDCGGRRGVQDRSHALGSGPLRYVAAGGALPLRLPASVRP